MAIVLTGIGARTPLGCSFEECLDNLQKGIPCVGDIENYCTDGYEMTAAGEIRHDGEVVRTPPDVDRKVHFFEQALEELGRKTRYSERYRSDELMLNVGGGVDYFDFDSYMRVRNLEAIHYKMNAEMQDLGHRYGIRGGCHLFSSACTASAHAIGLSLRILRRNLAGAVITGGADSMIAHLPFIGFYKLGALSMSDDASAFKCKPCDLRASGTVLSEASVAIMMENSDNVPSDIPVLAEVAGYGCTMDAYAVTEPEPSGEQAAKAIEAALADAGIGPDEIDCIHIHGTGTPKCGPVEYAALKRVFGDRTGSIPVYSMKGQVGHAIGSCTAVEMIGVIHSLEAQEVLPTVNFNTPNPAAPLRLITGSPLRMPIKYVLKINSAFGGHNTALILKKWEK